jgi:hypothetical protein
MSPETKQLRARLAGVPAPALTPAPAVEHAIAASVAYLSSDAALRSLEVDPYWPKWDSPWWHMRLLHELDEAPRIPARTAAAMVASLDRLPLHSFPIQPGEAPPGTDLSRDITCHCALGSMYQVLAACGVDVDRALPWIVPWFVRYQMADGGLSCDEHAYLRTDECPSSMVGTIAPFEAMLGRGQPDPFLDRGARFLIERTLSQGSSTVHNAVERERAPAWRLPCFPRFYFYDVLRGLAALVPLGRLERTAAAARRDRRRGRSPHRAVPRWRRARRAPGPRRLHDGAARPGARAQPARPDLALRAPRGDERGRRTVAGVDPPVDHRAARPARPDRRRPARRVAGTLRTRGTRGGPP